MHHQLRVLASQILVSGYGMAGELEYWNVPLLYLTL
jgi:hypothetical protein